MRHVVEHDLGLDLASRTARLACAEYAQRFARFQPQFLWSDAQHGQVSFAASGLQLRGRFDIAADRLILDLEVPLLLRPLQGRAVAVIDRELGHWLERAKAGRLSGLAPDEGA